MNYAVVDTETANTPKINGKLDTDNGQVYDFGTWIINDKGEKLEHLSLVNKDVFFGMKEAMQSAYYADKIPQYMRDIWDKKRTVVDTWQMWQKFTALCKKYDVQGIIAHNAFFDLKVLNSTMRYQTKSKKRFFFPYGIPIIDSMKLAQKTICKTDEYISWCKENGYMTNHATPRPRASAEILWRYLSKDNEFQEEHTALSDVEIETEIFLKCLQYQA